MQIVFLRWTAAALLGLALAGCLSLPRAIMPCPLTYSEQEKELLAIVPKGIRQEEALRRLAAAGVEGSFGISRRVYYCDLWNRSNGDRWHINVALLFDDTGKFYRTQTAECDVTSVHEERNGSGSTQAELPSQSAATSADAGSLNSTGRPSN
jgi:hypothetical protein